MEAKKATTARVENFIMIVLEKYTVVEFDESVKLNFVSISNEEMKNSVSFFQYFDVGK